MSENSSLWESSVKAQEIESTPRRLEAGDRRPSAVGSIASATVTLATRVRRHFEQELSPRHADYIVVLFWFMTGFLDSTIFQGELRNQSPVTRRQHPTATKVKTDCRP